MILPFKQNGPQASCRKLQLVFLSTRRVGCVFEQLRSGLSHDAVSSTLVSQSCILMKVS